MDSLAHFKEVRELGLKRRETVWSLLRGVECEILDGRLAPGVLWRTASNQV